MKSFHLKSYAIIFITYIIFLFSQIKSQEAQQPQEKELLNNCIFSFNKTENRLAEFSEKMKNIKYNIFLKIRYKDLKRRHNKIKTTISTIKEKLETNNYNKKVIGELNILKGIIEKYDRKCDKAIDAYYKAESLKIVIYNIIKIFFLIILIIIIAIMIIIGIVSFFIIKSQRKYYALEEEEIHSNIEVNIENQFNTEQIRIEEKLDEENEKDNSSKREIKKKKGTKKKKSGAKHQKS